MGFETLQGTPIATGIRLEQARGQEQFRLLDSFRYRSRRPGRDDEVLTVDSESLGLTDLASVPSPFRWFVGAYGKQTLPSLLHDALTRKKCVVEPERDIGQHEADDIFGRALLEEGVRPHRALLMWTAVSCWNRAKWKPRWALIPLVAWLVAAALGTGMATGFFHWGWCVPGFSDVPLWLSVVVGVLAALPGGLLWWPRWRAGLVIGWGIVLIGPPSLLALIATLVDRFPIRWMEKLLGLAERLKALAPGTQDAYRAANRACDAAPVERAPGDAGHVRQ